MLKRYQRQQSLIETFFKEAPDDENDQVSVTVTPRENRGTDYSDDATNINASPRNNRGDDYETDDTPNDTPEQSQQDTPDQPDTDAGPDTGDDGGTDYGDTGEGNAVAEDEGADGDEGEDGPDTGDDGTDYSDPDAQGDAPEEGTDDNQGEEKSPEELAEDTKKYHMYRRFMHLYTILESIIEKCRSVVKNDSVQNAVIKVVSTNLSDIYDNMYDFMTIKFKSATYIQILVYFETVISAIHLNFELLRNNKINLKQ